MIRLQLSHDLSQSLADKIEILLIILSPEIIDNQVMGQFHDVTMQLRRPASNAPETQVLMPASVVQHQDSVWQRCRFWVQIRVRFVYQEQA